MLYQQLFRKIKINASKSMYCVPGEQLFLLNNFTKEQNSCVIKSNTLMMLNQILKNYKKLHRISSHKIHIQVIWRERLFCFIYLLPSFFRELPVMSDLKDTS